MRSDLATLLAVWRLDRLGRSFPKHLIELMAELAAESGSDSRASPNPSIRPNRAAGWCFISLGRSRSLIGI